MLILLKQNILQQIHALFEIAADETPERRQPNVELPNFSRRRWKRAHTPERQVDDTILSDFRVHEMPFRRYRKKWDTAH